MQRSITKSLTPFPGSKNDRGVWIGCGKVLVELTKYSKSVISHGLVSANTFTEDALTTILKIGVIQTLIGMLEMTNDDEIDDEESDEGTGANSANPCHNCHKQLITDANIFTKLAKHSEFTYLWKLHHTTVLQMPQ